MEEGHKKVSVIIKQERVTMKQADVLKLTLWFLELCKIVIGIKGKQIQWTEDWKQLKREG